MLKKIIIQMIRWYQQTLSFDHGFLSHLFPSFRICTMYPSCSMYTKIAIQKYGLKQGLLKGFVRILRCHPWQKKIIDHP